VTAGRGILLVLGIVLAIAGPMARAVEAQAPRVIKIGALTDSWGPTPAIIGLRDGLQELGYRENQDFVLGVRFTQGNVAELPEAARALVRHGVDIVIASSGGTNAAKAAQMATTRIPIVFMAGSDPIGAGLVKSFARPGGNITGIAEVDLVPKRMEIFRELVPGLKRVSLVYDATDPDTVSRLEVYRTAAHRLGLTLVERPVRTEDEARMAISAVRKGEIDGFLSPRTTVLNIPGLILEIAPKRAIPAMFHDAIFVEQGGLASYSSNLYELGRQAARLVDKILKGAKPGDVPVEQPTKFELVINLKTAKALGLTIPPSLLQRADQVIE
jgi:putative tryptophan/tyrosine transport system substrate-binding protein